MTALLRRAIVLATATLVASSAESAHAYVRQTAKKTHVPISWHKTTVTVTPNSAGSADLGPEATLSEIRQAAENWNGQIGSCSFISIDIGAPKDGVVLDIDQVNIVTWLENEWGRTMDGTFYPYAGGATALTTLSYYDSASRSDNGRVLDGDVELNGANFIWGNVDGNSTPDVFDIQDVLTHEFGHLLALDHACWDGVDPPERPVDSKGNPVPSCGGDLPPEITDSTMYNFGAPGETKKRTPEPDDIAGICGIYPISADSGCAVAPRGGFAVGTGVIVGVLLGLLAQNRRTKNKKQKMRT